MYSQETALTRSTTPIPAQRSILGLAIATLALASCGGGNGNASDILPVAPMPAQEVAINPTVPCTMQGIGAAALSADAAVTVLDVSTGTTGSAASDKQYCLVKVKVDPQVNIWVSLPMSAWNGRFRAEGNGVTLTTLHFAAISVQTRVAFVRLMY